MGLDLILRRERRRRQRARPEVAEGGKTSVMPSILPPPPPRGVLFDLDGTLVASPLDFPMMKRAVLEVVADHGVDPAPLADLDILAIVEAALRRAGRGSEFAAAAEARLAEIELAASAEATAIPGAEALLGELCRAGLAVGIVTRNCRVAACAMLERFKLPHQVLVTRGDVARVKPDPLHLLTAATQLAVVPEECVMVGDHRMDVLAGRAAGMRTVGFLTAERPPGFFDDLMPDLVVRQLCEVRPWIFPS